MHETDNFSAGADAAAHNSFIHQNADADSGIVSWHYTVDDHEIYHHLPDTETAYHAGDVMTEGGGNMNGIGIEMCVNAGGNYEQTLINTEKLCAQLLPCLRSEPGQGAQKASGLFVAKVCPVEPHQRAAAGTSSAAAVNRRNTQSSRPPKRKSIISIRLAAAQPCAKNREKQGAICRKSLFLLSARYGILQNVRCLLPMRKSGRQQIY
ncbi:MAG: N-acetylmuramoyl-L-alanine amidase [Butyricicoccaceae bacterium]